MFRHPLTGGRGGVKIWRRKSRRAVFQEENNPGGELIPVAAKGMLIRGMAHAWIFPRMNDASPLQGTEYWLES
ncbi:MAG: hypothetical protein CMP31_00220 [Roseibacillus sp.]|nr:hypothetical protein [Roseibacillus sp.]